MNDTVQAPGRAIAKRLADCTKLGEAFETMEFRRLIGEAIPRHMDGDAMLRAFVQAAGKTPNIYHCDLRQTIGCMMSLAYLGLVPGTVLQHAHLIPFAKSKYDPAKRQWVPDGYDLQIIIGYPGYVELASRSGVVKDIATGIIFPGEHIEYERGSKRYFSHKPNIDMATAGLTPRAAYCVATFIEGGEEIEVMSWPDVLAIRNRSQGYQTALRAKEAAEDDAAKNGRALRLPRSWTDAAWVRDDHEMGRKTALRRAQKLWPKCPELRAATAIEDAQDSGTKLDWGPVIEGKATPMDGIPVASDGTSPPDPGAAFTDRREPAPPTQTTQTTQTATEPKQAETQQRAETTEFGAYIVDQFGEVGDEPFDDPVVYANALVAVCTGIRTVVDRDAFLEFNGDFIAEASAASPAAAAILIALKASAASDDTGGAPMPADPVIRPPGERGRTSWSKYDSLLKAAIGHVRNADLPAWIEAQRAVMTEAPQVNKIRAAAALRTACNAAGVPLPAWVPEMIKPAPRAENTEADVKWVDELIEELEVIGRLGATAAARSAYAGIAANSAVTTRMKRLARENVDLFNRGDEVFARIGKQIGVELPGPPGQQSDQDQEIPPNDGED
jgi:phage RecT family recombinase